MITVIELLQFVMYVATEKEEGLYNLYFHSCPNYDNKEPVFIDFTVCIKVGVLLLHN